MELKYSKQAVKAINGMDKPSKQRLKKAVEALPDDLAAIDLARAEYAKGETVSHNDINWD